MFCSKLESQLIERQSLGVVRIFDWGREANRKSHGMMLSKLFEKKDFIWNKDSIEWRIRSRDLGRHDRTC